VSIECRFGIPLETAIIIVVLGEFQSLIDANRKCCVISTIEYELATDYEHSQE
jgi:hypothetical protein